jgi:cytidyltransferase-like protein
MDPSKLSPGQIKALVREGWNKRSYAYRPEGCTRDGTSHTDREYRSWIAPILQRLPKRGKVLDLGCGAGIPVSSVLSRRFNVTGVDISEVQIARARKLVPRARFIRADMSAVRFPPACFHAVVSFYSIIHLPLKEQRPLLRRIYQWLAPGGIFVAILGAGKCRDLAKGWLGSDSWMYWDHSDPGTYQRWLEDIGFVLEEMKFIPEFDSGHEFFRLRKPIRTDVARLEALDGGAATGVYWGRFNPPHKGHMSVIRTFNERCNLTVAIGSSEHSDEKTNPFSGPERKRMMVSYLKEMEIKGVKVVTLNDGESESWAVDNLIKSCRPDVVFLSTERSTLADLTAKRVDVVSFRRTGKISSTRIRDLIASGKEGWRDLTGPSVARLILELDGVRRIRKAYGLTGRHERWLSR